MNIKFLCRDDIAEEDSVVCVIDVISAFTTAAYLFSQGAKEIIIASSLKEAFEYKQEINGLCLIGEENGERIDGFHYHNSVLEFSKVDFNNKFVLLKTTSGTKGLINNWNAKLVLAASFVNADATAKYLRDHIEKNNISTLSFIITNNFKSSEDFALAGYICDKIFNRNNILNSYLDIVKKSEYGKFIINTSLEIDEMDYVLNANKFDFVMLPNIYNNKKVLCKK
ncbi:MAG TPA: hypothetical protein EYG89_03430 [Bacteroidia bacterium]|nr:hypothetical protein [Bacteroidia bacterium]